MTKQKSTKRALLTSALALLMCVSMLIGSTFAWFTDSVTSGSNVITAGNLDIDVQYTLGDKDDNGNFEWKNLNGADDLFQKGLWEPGHTEVVALKIENKGSLALKYNANMNIVNETVGTNKDGEDIKLSDILTVSTLTQQAVDSDGNANQIGAITLGRAFKGENSVAYETTTKFNKAILKGDTELLPGAAHYVIVKVDMAETVGNEANAKDQNSVPSIEFGINVFATQYTKEYDSFGNQYDANAPIVTVVDEPYVFNYTATESYTVEGGGQTIIGKASSADEFTWDGTIPEMSNIFSSANGSKVTVNDLTFTGTMSSVMAGHYVNATYNNYNTEFNNVNIVGAEVVSFSSNISPALTVYGTAVLNNCNITGTKLSALDTDPMWPVYDMAVVNYSNTTLNNTKVGSIFAWNQAELIVADGSEVDTIVVRGNANTRNDYQVITVKAGATVDAIDLSAITDVNKVMITIEDGATFGGYVDDEFAGVTFATLDAWKAAKNGGFVGNGENLDDVIKSGANTIVLPAGNYIIPDSAQGKTLTIIGTGNTVIATQDDGSYEGCDYSFDGSTVTFENITINTTSKTYTGYARCKGTYNNCTINGTYTLYGDSEFNNCTFNVTGDVYNVWTWGADNATFNGCTFNSDGKALLLYGQKNTKLTVNNCVFNDKGGLTDKKAAIEIGNDYNKSYTLIVNNTTVNGYEINDKGINTNSTLWGNKNSMGTDKLNVVVDSVDVY